MGPDLDWLLAGASRAEARRLRSIVDVVCARGIAEDALQAALVAAYWAAQYAAIPHVVSGQRRALTRQQRALARLDEAITAVLDWADLVSAELAGHLHVARAKARQAAIGLRPPGALAPGRPAGWREQAERTMVDLGLRRQEARPLLRAIAALVAGRPLRPGQVPYLRVAYRLQAPDRGRVLARLLPAVANADDVAPGTHGPALGGKPSGSPLFPAVAVPQTGRG